MEQGLGLLYVLSWWQRLKVFEMIAKMYRECKRVLSVQSCTVTSGGPESFRAAEVPAEAEARFLFRLLIRRPLQCSSWTTSRKLTRARRLGQNLALDAN
jgi:hypothetical protein